MHVAQFVHRYPPAIGGAEAYTARLCDYLAARGHSMSVWTTTAVDLPAFWECGHRETVNGSESLRSFRSPLPSYSFPRAALPPQGSVAHPDPPPAMPDRAV